VKKKVKLKKAGLLFFGVLGVWLVHCWISKGEVLMKNFGISLSWNWGDVLLLNIFFILILGWWYFRNNFWSLSFILIGGVVNLLDRLNFGYVRDYWELGWGIVNNLSDWLIALGVLLFLIEILWKRQK
jgi:lipoprotein signal peptidase